MKYQTANLEDQSTNMVLKAAKLIKSIDYDLSKIYGDVNHNTRERRGVDRRIAYYKCLCDTAMFTMREICFIIYYGLKIKTPQTHALVIHSRKKAEGFILTNDNMFMPIYNEIKREVERAAKNKFSTPVINSVEMQFIDENFLP